MKIFILTFLALVSASCSKNNFDGRNDNLDITFDHGIGVDGDYSNAACLAIQTNGQIIIGGQFISFNHEPQYQMVRLNSDGTTDKSFHVGREFNSYPAALAIQTDGKIIVGGVGGIPGYITRLNSNGTPDQNFHLGTGFNNNVFSLAIQPDGKIITGGEFTSFNGYLRKRIACLNNDGTLDDSFNPEGGFDERVYSILLQPE